MHSQPTYRHFIPKHEISALPLRSYTGAIHMVDSEARMKVAARYLSREKIIGFDTESRPAFRAGESYPPSLVQLAASDAVFIFQLSHIPSHQMLAEILADRKVLKAGIAVNDDIIKLSALFHFMPAGFVEIAELRAKLGIKNAGLRGLAALLFGVKISKHAKISRWDAPKLTHEQIVYAATDAWMCREIYFELLDIMHGRKRLEERGHPKKRNA
jgi:ribonuclease D